MALRTCPRPLHWVSRGSVKGSYNSTRADAWHVTEVIETASPARAVARMVLEALLVLHHLIPTEGSGCPFHSQPWMPLTLERAQFAARLLAGTLEDLQSLLLDANQEWGWILRVSR